MSCRCPQCDWPIYTMQPVRMKCFKCGADVACGEGPLPEEKPPQPVPRDKWPAWAILVRCCKFPDDAGIGDTVKHVADSIGGERFKVWAAQCGIPCGCTARQERWNALYPYQN